MNISELKGELHAKMIELGMAIDLEMPYTETKKIYERIKQLQFDLALVDLPKTTDNSEIVMV